MKKRTRRVEPVTFELAPLQFCYYHGGGDGHHAVVRRCWCWAYHSHVEPIPPSSDLAAPRVFTCPETGRIDTFKFTHKTYRRI